MTDLPPSRKDWPAEWQNRWANHAYALANEGGESEAEAKRMAEELCRREYRGKQR